MLQTGGTGRRNGQGGAGADVPDHGAEPMTSADLKATARRDSASADGRTAIRDRNRKVVLDTMIELFTEGNLDPSPEDVAPRAGLSVRSVYRYFEDGDGLVRAAIERHLDLIRPLYKIPAIGEGDLDERIERFAAVRVRVYERTASTARAARLRSTYDPLIREELAEGRDALRDQTARHFQAELAEMGAERARSRLAVLDSLTGWDSLEYFRFHRRFSGRETRALLADSIRALLRA